MLWGFLAQTSANMNARELMQELLHCGIRISSRLQAFAAHYLPMAESWFNALLIEVRVRRPHPMDHRLGFAARPLFGMKSRWPLHVP